MHFNFTLWKTTTLTKNLEDKIRGVIRIKKINDGLSIDSAPIGPRNTPMVIGTQTNELKYNGVSDFANGFAYYIIGDLNDGTHVFTDKLKEKFQDANIQPQGFAETNLIHKIEKIPYGVAQYFLDINMEKQREYITPEVGIAKTDKVEDNKVISKNHIVNHLCGLPYETTMSTNEVASLLGLTNWAVSLAVKEKRMDSKKVGTGRGHHTFSPQQVLAFVIPRKVGKKGKGWFVLTPEELEREVKHNLAQPYCTD